MTHSIRAFAWGLLFLVAQQVVGLAQVDRELRSPPLFTGKSLPTSPGQQEDWVPPATKLPEKCVTAIQALIKYGFANPRGCEYREVEILCGAVWIEPQIPFKTHAWVLP